MGRHVLYPTTKPDGSGTTDTPSMLRIYLDTEPEHHESPWVVDGCHWNENGIKLTDDVEWFRTLPEALIGALHWARAYPTFTPGLKQMMRRDPDGYLQYFVNGSDENRGKYATQAHQLWAH